MSCGWPHVMGRRASSVTVAPVIAPTLRPAARVAAVAASICASVVTSAIVVAGPAMAIGERGTPGDRLTPLTTVALFVGIPLAAASLIAFLVFLPSIVSGPRYRPGRPWSATASWFGESIGTGEALMPDITALPEATREGGGASARW
jgi:hypothetical protein